MKNVQALILGISMVVAATIFGWFFLESRQPQQTVKVVGYATEDFKSNIVKWSVSIVERVSLNDAQRGYLTMGRKLGQFRDLWTQTGIQASEYTVFPVNVNMEYGPDGPRGYVLTQRVVILSDQIEEVQQLAVNPEVFVKEDVVFENSIMEFFSTELDSIKKQLIARATENARERAEQVVEATGLRVDKLISARSGVFQITEPFSTEVAAYGIHDTSSPRKSIKVTVSADFSIE